MLDFFLDAYRQAPRWIVALEALAFVAGIVSVWYAKKQNILVYPIGLVGTSITMFLLYRVYYYGDMIVNAYYSLMSVYGWYVWSRNSVEGAGPAVSRTNKREKIIGTGLFFLTIIVILVVYNIFGRELNTENYFDILASGVFFTAMWFMARKKIENWMLWIVGNSIAIPLYAYRGLGMLALQYIIFTMLAVQAYYEWKRHLNKLR